MILTGVGRFPETICDGYYVHKYYDWRLFIKW